MPSSRIAICETTIVFRLTTSASVTIGFENWCSSRLGGTCVKIAMTGSTMNDIATAIARKNSSGEQARG